MTAVLVRFREAFKNIVHLLDRVRRGRSPSGQQAIAQRATELSDYHIPSDISEREHCRYNVTRGPLKAPSAWGRVSLTFQKSGTEDGRTTGRKSEDGGARQASSGGCPCAAAAGPRRSLDKAIAASTRRGATSRFLCRQKTRRPLSGPPRRDASNEEKASVSEGTEGRRNGVEVARIEGNLTHFLDGPLTVQGRLPLRLFSHNHQKKQENFSAGRSDSQTPPEEFPKLLSPSGLASAGPRSARRGPGDLAKASDHCMRR
ncbi:hypothetical protein GGE46_004666 [Rhizobium etli]|uniref:Uncharacterized protein n=1 Tax=Rhizobium etli TaxID=29449 RepID=A0A7W6ZLA8_RHIET|nr:hypothetical protein [Rhizobium etli]MBB4537892.1 hypothetical protein [Rhizobium etli]